MAGRKRGDDLARRIFPDDEPQAKPPKFVTFTWGAQFLELGGATVSEPTIEKEPVKIRFLAGNVVALKSGGQRMTAERVREDGYVFCVWFGSGDELHRELIGPHSLNLVLV